MIESILGLGIAYFMAGFLVWGFIILHGGFMMPDGKTPAPFWHCMFQTVIMWPAALKALDIL